MFGEETTALQRCAHSFKITGRNINLHRSDDGFPRLHHIAFGENDVLIETATKWNAVGSSRRPHAGNGANDLEGSVHEWPQFLRRIFHLRRRGRNRNDSFAFETWIHSQQFPETCEQESCPDQQHTRETNLRQYEPTPHCTRIPPVPVRVSSRRT